MQKIEYFRRALQLFAVGRIFCVGVSFLVLAAISVHADGLVSSPAKGVSGVGVVGVFASASKNLKFDAREPEIKMPARPVARPGPFLIVQKNLGIHGRSNEFLFISAGYGKIWDDKSVFQKICPDHQDPGWAYVKTSFSF